MATSKTLFELNFERHLWKGNLVISTEFPRLEKFLTRLQRSWEEATKLIEEAQESMKKQFDQKRRNPQRLKIGDNI